MSTKPQILIARFYGQVAKLTLVISIIWMMVVVSNTLQKDYPADVEPELLTPLTPVIDEGVVEAITRREQMDSLLSTYVPVSPSPKPVNN